MMNRPTAPTMPGATAAHPDPVGVVFAAVAKQGASVRQHPQDAVATLTPLWSGLPAAEIETMNRRRNYAGQPVEKAGLGQQKAIADRFLAAGPIPKAIDATIVSIWYLETRP